MIRKFVGAWALGLLVASMASAQAVKGLTAVRLAPSSFTQDGIVDYGNPNPPATITATMDNGTAKTNNTWYEIGQDQAAATTGIPSGYFTGQTDPTSSFYFENARTDASLNNILLLDNPAAADVATQGPPHLTGTLTFLKPQVVTSFALATSSGNGAGTMTATVHYLNGTADVTGLTITSPDWFGAADPRVVTSHGRISFGSDGKTVSYNNIAADNPRIYEELVQIPNATTSDLVKSIDLSFTNAAGHTHTFVFGVSAIPEPASFGLLALSGLALLARRRA